jgi:hypothetical protein
MNRCFLDSRASLPIGAVRWAGLALLAGLALGLAACAGFSSYKLESRPMTQPIVIDGKSDDWHGNMYINAQGQYSLGFINDAKDLYVCLVVTDPYKRAQILRGGLILWLDPKGGETKRLGINYPLASQNPEGRRAAGAGPEETPPGPPEDEGEQSAPSRNWTDFGIITPNSQMPLMIKPEPGQGLVMKASAPAGLFVAEFKIPLQRSDKEPWAVGGQPGQTVSVGFETGRMPSQRTGRGRGGYGGYGGRGGYPGGYGGRSGMGGEMARGGMGPGVQIPEELRVWAQVKLR